jgi:hypothetical protein
LHVDEGKIAYCYPFAVFGTTSTQPEELVRGIKALRRGDLLGNARVADVGKLDVTDVWEANDPEKRAYTGFMITMDDLLIVTTAEKQLPAHHVELRISTLGICHLRIWTWLANISAHELNQAMRRGLVQMGAETIRQDGPVSGNWSRLTAYVEEVIRGLEQHLAALSSAQLTPRDSRNNRLRVLFSVDRRHHTVVSLRGFSQVIPTGEQVRLYSYTGIRGTVGAALLEQQVNHTAATLEEYVRYPCRTPRALAEDIGFQGEALALNADSTVVVMPTSPNFIVIGYEEMAEFSAALPALLDQWIEVIYDQRRSLSKHLHDLDDLWWNGNFDTRNLEQVSAQVYNLEQRQAKLRDVVGEARSMLAFMKSPALCRTSKYRDMLDMLFDAAGVGRLEADLEAQVAQVNALFVQVQDRADQLEERRTQRSRRWMETALAVLAVTSLADFCALINNAIADWSIFSEVGVISVLMIVAYFVVKRSHKRNRDTSDRTRHHPPCS